jgi:hypothetical protein
MWTSGSIQGEIYFLPFKVSASIVIGMPPLKPVGPQSIVEARKVFDQQLMAQNNLESPGKTGYKDTPGRQSSQKIFSHPPRKGYPRPVRETRTTVLLGVAQKESLQAPPIDRGGEAFSFGQQPVFTWPM